MKFSFSLTKQEGNSNLLLTRLALLSLVWVCSLTLVNYVGLLFPSINYEEFPFGIGAYYLCIMAFLLCYFPETSCRLIRTGSLQMYAMLLLINAFVLLFYGFVVPSLDPGGLIATSYYPITGSFLDGRGAYVFVKMIEIALQQMVIVACIFSLASYKNSVLFVSLVFSFFFGAFHIIVFPFLGSTLGVIFSLASCATAALFPYLILRVKDGFEYTYAIHWLFYLVTVTAMLSVR